MEELDPISEWFIIVANRNRLMGYLDRYITINDLFKTWDDVIATKEDLVSETYLKVYTAWKNGKLYNDGRLESLIFTATKNLAKSEIRRRNTRQTISTDANTNPQIDNNGTDYDSCIMYRIFTEGFMPSIYYPDEIASAGILEERLYQAIDELSPARKQALFLGSQGYSYKEIAAEMGCSIGTAKSRINRARKLIKAKVEIPYKIALILEAHEKGMSQREAAKYAGVRTHATVQYYWKKFGLKAHNKKNGPLSKDKVLLIKEAHKKGMSQSETVEYAEVVRATISNQLNRLSLEPNYSFDGKPTSKDYKTEREIEDYIREKLPYVQRTNPRNARQKRSTLVVRHKRDLHIKRMKDIIDAYARFGGSVEDMTNNLPYANATIYRYLGRLGLPLKKERKPYKKVNEREKASIIAAYRTCNGDAHKAARDLSRSYKTVQRYWKEFISDPQTSDS